MTKAKIGVLMLNTSFERIKGDIGNKETFDFPVIYETVEQATVDRVVKEANQTLIEPFIKAGKRLETRGVRAITTSCGFLALFQKEIQKELTVPFYSSSLIQIPMISLIAGGKVGVLTAKKSSLTDDHFLNVNVDPSSVIIAGMDDMDAFRSAIIEETAPLNSEAVSLEVKHAIEQLIKKHPEIRAIVLECTNLPPYKEAIKQVTNLPIFDIETLTNYIYNSL